MFGRWRPIMHVIHLFGHWRLSELSLGGQLSWQDHPLLDTIMTSRLKRKLNDLGIDTSSSKANENFCLVRLYAHHS